MSEATWAERGCIGVARGCLGLLSLVRGCLKVA